MGKVKFPALLLILAGIFASFLLGMFVGRRTGGEILYIDQEQSAASRAFSTEAASAGNAVSVPTESGERVNVNPGIGEILAQRIVDYREANGPFRCLDELCDVEGIGEKRVENLRDYAVAR